MKVHHFRHDHTQVKSDLDALRELAHAGVAAHAHEIAHQLVAMAVHIKIHLASEDRLLYPVLETCGDATLATEAAHYQHEMGGLAQSFDQFVEQWRRADHVAADAEGFRADANRVLKALHERLRREETVFFPLIEERLPDDGRWLSRGGVDGPTDVAH